MEVDPPRVLPSGLWLRLPHHFSLLVHGAHGGRLGTGIRVPFSRLTHLSPRYELVLLHLLTIYQLVLILGLSRVCDRLQPYPVQAGWNTKKIHVWAGNLEIG